MPDYIGSIPVPEVAPFGTFPLVVLYPLARTIAPNFAIHTFTAGNVKREQRFELGPAPRLWRISQQISQAEYRELREFYEAHYGSVYPFTFNDPQRDGTKVAYTVQFEDEPLAGDVATANGYVNVSVTLRQVNTGLTAAPVYPLNEVNTRFPAAALSSALAQQAQQIIPLVSIRPRLSTYPVIAMSDRRVNIGGTVYAARLLEAPSIRQSAAGSPGAAAETDEATINCGNADRVMSDLTNAVILDFALVTISFFHVGSGVLLNLWTGEITKGGVTIDGGTCTIRCSDPMANPFVIVPHRRIDRSCTAPYNIAPLCPWSTVSNNLDTAHFPSASAASCDHGYDTPNGCLAHLMNRYYRGVPVSPQPFRSKDNSGNWFSRALKRSAFTQLSQVSDTVIGQTLPMVFTSGVDVPMKAMIVTGADQGDFYEAVGIIGMGPIGQLGPALNQTLDGQPTHDMVRFPPRFGAGAEPTGQYDFISLSWNGNQVNGDWRKVYVGNSTYINNRGAGVAFVGLRRTDTKGEQLTRLDEHEMEVTVRYGLVCWAWDGAGNRSSGYSVNPVWIALNVYLWAIGVHEIANAAMLNYFDLPSVLTAAQICEWDVAAIVGSGTEKQFQYYGVISEERPLRDWLEDILRNCLGTFAVVNGKLRIDIRVNASAVAAFTEGNLIHGTVKTGPPGRQFNRFTVNFSDRVLDTLTQQTLFLPNTATAYDQDFALEMGGGAITRYFNAETNLSGTNTVSQAQRIANVRLREEVGGVTPAERLAHVNVQGSTTILGLDFCAGQVISVSHGDVPGAFVKLRVSTWEMTPDYRINFSGVTVRDSMYDLVAGPKPGDVAPDIIVPEQQPLAYRPMWHPNDVGSYYGDPVYPPGCNSFSMRQRYIPTANGGIAAILEVTGDRPVNIFAPNTYPPTYRRVTTGAGGVLPDNATYFAALACRSGSNNYSPPCRIRPIFLGPGQHSFTIQDIVWPAPAFGAWYDWQLFVGRDDDRMVTFQASGMDFAATAVTLSDHLYYSMWAPPSPVSRRLLAMAKPAVHWGIWAEEIAAVYADGGIQFVFLTGTAQSYIGRKLSVVTDRSGLQANIWNFTVVSQDLPTGRLFLNPNPYDAGVQVGDLATPLLDPNVYTGMTIGDAMVQNVRWPSGLIPNGEVGKMIRGLTPGRPHQIRFVKSNNQTTYTVDRTFDYKPLYYSVEEPGWPYDATSGLSVENDQYGSKMTVQIPVDNLGGLPIVVGAGIEDRFGTKTPEELMQIRFTYLYGSPPPAKRSFPGRDARLFLGIDDGSD